MRISDWSSDVCSSDLAVEFGGQFLEDRPQRLAWPAPLGPAVDQYRRLQGFLQHLGLEGGGSGVEDVRSGGGTGGHSGHPGRVPAEIVPVGRASNGRDRKHDVSGTRVSVRVDLGGRRYIKTKIKTAKNRHQS